MCRLLNLNKRLAKCFLLSLIALFFVSVLIFHYQFNMTGYWLGPLHLYLSTSETKFVRTQREPDLRSTTNEAWDKLKKSRTLVNVYEGLKSENSDFIDKTKQNSRTINILWYNKPVWIDIGFANRALQDQCSYQNCRMTSQTSELRHSDAVVFSLTHLLDSKPPISSHERDPNQIWIFFGLESPYNYIHFGYRHKNWKNTMNWSMSYNFDADIFYPYGMLEKRTTPVERNYSAVFRKKTKFAAWFVSHCGTASMRDDFVSELKSAGIEVDIFGRCLDDRFLERSRLLSLINTEYKFYFSFENSFCKDYVTEKFFRYYNSDVILVVRGGNDYDRSLPNDTFINSQHFRSARDLAKYLTRIGASEQLFTNYLKRKDKYVASEMFTMASGHCSMCEKVNNLDKYSYTYSDHVTYVHADACWMPSDVTYVKYVYWFVAIVLCVSCIVVLITKYRRKCTSRHLQ